VRLHQRPNGRALLREVLVGPLRFVPQERRYRFEGEAAIGRLLTGVMGVPIYVASPAVSSWNQVQAFLQQMARLRESIGIAE